MTYIPKLTAMVLASALALTAAVPAVAAEAGSLKLGMGTWVGYCPVYVAIDQGLYAKHGLDLELMTFQGNDAAAAFAAGRLDLTSTAGSSALTLAANGVKFKNFLVADFSVGADGILARSRIADLAALKGERIGVELVAVSHFFLIEALDKAGLTEDDVTLINLAPDVAAAAYKSGEVDVAVTYAPYLGQMNAEVKDGRILIDSTAMPTAIVDYYQARDEVLAEKPLAIEAFVRGTLDGLAFIDTNRPKALEVCGKAMDVSPEQVNADLNGVKLATLDDNVAAMTDPSSKLFVTPAMEALASFLHAKGQIGAIAHVAGLQDASFVLKVAGR